jgi:TATA-box binding protein (TBP) (component of TFIID and TFIIIB)
MNPTPLRVSTMTVTGHLGAIPDLQRLYDAAHFIPYWWIGQGILKIEFGENRKGICMEDILHTTAKVKKRFFNQASLVFRLELSQDTKTFKETNIKLFKNGGFQMTGISSAEMARAALTQMIALNKDRGIWSTEPYIKSFDVCMMNSDYNVGKAIRRDRLYRILVEKFGLQSSFEPMRYQGVNTKFFWNSARPPTAPPGICPCPVPCNGEADGSAIGKCKKITISPFRTGSIIITGAKEPKQLMDAYEFMNSVLSDHADLVLRDEPVLDTPVNQKKKAAPPLNNTEAILRQKMRASPRNVVRI